MPVMEKDQKNESNMNSFNKISQLFKNQVKIIFEKQVYDFTAINNPNVSHSGNSF